MNLSEISTEDLVKELQNRSNVEYTEVSSLFAIIDNYISVYEDEVYRNCGSATILIVFDK